MPTRLPEEVEAPGAHGYGRMVTLEWPDGQPRGEGEMGMRALSEPRVLWSAATGMTRAGLLARPTDRA